MRPRLAQANVPRQARAMLTIPMESKAEKGSRKESRRVSLPNCPYCNSDSVRRSRRRPEDGAVRSLFCKAYRCLDCTRRFFRPSTRRVLGAAGVAALIFTVLLVLAWSV
jgi:transposase-like protein